MTRRLILLPVVAAVLAVVGLQITAVADPRLPDPTPGPTSGSAVATPAPTIAPPTARPTPTAAAPQATGPTADRRIGLRLQERLDALRRDLGIPGVQVTITYADGTSWTGTSGYADIASSSPVGPRTPFPIASISKTFTAAVILQLVGEGVLGLDDSAVTHLPSLDLDARITVRQLLDHTSGLNDYLMRQVVDRALRADLAAVWTEERALSQVGKPYFNPGRGWHYSSTNYVILGLLAEAVTGEPLADLLRTRIFDPLGLRTASYQGVEPPTGPIARAYRFTVSAPRGAATEWDDGSDVVPFTAVVTATAGAGSIAAASSDVARFAHAMWGGDLVPAWVLDAAVADAVRVGAMRGALPYGLGVQAYAVDGRPALGHSGRFSGTRSVVRYLPDEGIAIAVLTNQSRVDPVVILSRLLAIASPPHRAGSGLSVD